MAYYIARYNASPFTDGLKERHSYKDLFEARKEIHRFLTEPYGPTTASLFRFGKYTGEVLVGKATVTSFGPNEKRVPFKVYTKDYVIYTVYDKGRTNNYYLNKDGTLGTRV